MEATESKHTPGPWKFYESVSLEILAPDDWEIAVCNEWSEEDHGHNDCFANAHLIAAAPELLEALVALLHQHDEMAHQCPTALCGHPQANEIHARNIKALAKARAAIAKAKPE